MPRLRRKQHERFIITMRFQPVETRILLKAVEMNESLVKSLLDYVFSDPLGFLLFGCHGESPVLVTKNQFIQKRSAPHLRPPPKQ